ncbi:MAG: NAD(P)/FAD-dependent oxidoreductase [Thiobacillus sp.]
MTYNVLVIGAGISGLSAALTLLQRGHRITLLERGEAGAESSWAGGGILSPLLPWDYAGPVARLALRSMAQYADWVADFESRSGIDAEYWRCGMRVVAPPNPEAALGWCAAHGLAAHIERNGDLTLGEVAQVRNPRLVAALRAAVVQLGGVIRERCPATGVLTQAGRVTAVQTAAETFPADAVVLAAGAWSGIGLAGLPGVPGIRPIRGQMLLFRLAPGALDTVIYRDGLYLIPRRDGHVLVGSTLDDVGFDKSTDDATRLRLHSNAAELLPALANVQAVQHWAGLRPGSPDNIPVIDRHPDFDNVFINAGHYRYGVTMAPASAELLVDLMEGKAPALDPAPYRWAAALARRW